MILLFEGGKYKKEYIKGILNDSLYKQVTHKQKDTETVSLDCVGYYYNTTLDDVCFVLPKVFVTADKGFETFPTNEMVVVNHESIAKIKEQKWAENVLYDLPLWIYQAINKYRKKYINETSIDIQEKMQSLVSTQNEKGSNSLLDSITALKLFYLANSNLYIQVYKQTHTGFNKVNWAKTIRKYNPFIINNNPIYPVVMNHKKAINYDEELLVIFFNTLRYINNVYHFPIKVDEPYNLVPDQEFKRQVARGMVLRRLKEIRNNYFSDVMQQLWALLHIFHAQLNNKKGKEKIDDYLLIKDFNIVFEDMVNELLSDRDVPTKLIKQEDGKIVDHLFKYDSLIPIKKDVYYIGDSKYYRDGAIPEGASRYKQYTYAINILQAHFNWYHKDKTTDISNYRDELTEGYNITPNFFISGDVYPSDKYTVSRIKPDEEANKTLEKDRYYHFENRLFDRNTLFLRQYDISFLFVLYAYTAYNKNRIDSFKDEAKQLFKDDFSKGLKGKYKFYVARTKKGVDLKHFIDNNFRLLIGKVFCPYKYEKYSLVPQVMIVALEDGAAENKSILKIISNDFLIYNYALGQDIETATELNEISKEEIAAAEIENALPSLFPLAESNKYDRTIILIGCFKSQEHLKWIQKHNAYNVRWNESAKGSVKTNSKKYKAHYLLLYNIENPEERYIYKLSKANKNNILRWNDEIFADYPGTFSAKEYLVYKLGERFSDIGIDTISVNERMELNTYEGAPIYVYLSDITKKQ